jgi:D-glycero-D-manno-heptose 1,7-bisphosphate phosphatase
LKPETLALPSEALPSEALRSGALRSGALRSGKPSKALFLDRDGTIIEQFPSTANRDEKKRAYITELNQVEPISGSAEAIARARKLGYKTIIVTNQSAIARGWLTEEKLKDIERHMYELLKQQNPEAIIDDSYYCPYYAEGVVEKYKISSPDRKPGTGMIMKAKEKYTIDLKNSYMIGDSYTDIKCGLNAGTKTILVRTGYGEIAYKKCLDEQLKIDFIADNILEAVKYLEENDV